MSSSRRDSNPTHGLAKVTRSRTKRAQVVRACDSCRQHRIKCDSSVPCSNCDARGSHCSNVTVKSMSRPEAYREIERLRLKVQDLERKLSQERSTDSDETDFRPQTDAMSTSSAQLSASAASTCTCTEGSDNPHYQGGVYIRAGRSGNETWYGESSPFHFIGRMSRLLSSSLNKAHGYEEMLNPSSSTTLFGETPRMNDDDSNTDYDESPEIQNVIPDTDVSLARDFLAPMHEEYFLRLYWESYHTSVCPILDETKFKQHYRSLCSRQGSTRRPSPLVDIVVAICIQLGISSSSRQSLATAEIGAAVPGRQYYLRSQRQLAYEVENPTISTLQCQLLSSVYLCSATFHNMSDSTFATAVRTAFMLGLHVDPPDSTSTQDIEMRRRIWWALYIMDSKIGIKYGRPFLLQWTTTSPLLPDGTPETANQAGSDLTPLGDSLSWLSFHREHSKLFLAARSAYARCYNLEKSVCPTGTPASASANQEEVASSFAKELEAWADAVPPALKTKRTHNGRPFSTDTSKLNIDPYSPLWLQRQRLLLELMYHNICINLHRPFIQLDSGPKSRVADHIASKCARHGITLTKILHEVLCSTSILTGWQEAFQWQWNAAITLAGFVLASPESDIAASARCSLEQSVANLDDFGKSIAWRPAQRMWHGRFSVKLIKYFVVSRKLLPFLRQTGRQMRLNRKSHSWRHPFPMVMKKPAPQG